jgi:hypothetical protein
MAVLPVDTPVSVMPTEEPSAHVRGTERPGVRVPQFWMPPATQPYCIRRWGQVAGLAVDTGD